jgi:hypothetical protein
MDGAAIRVARWMLACVAVCATARAMWSQESAQSVPPSVKVKLTGAAGWPQKTVRFSDTKPVMGMPVDGSKSKFRCSADGTTFFDPSSASAAATGIYGVSPAGETKRVMRKLPLQFSSVSVLDFFAGERMLVTLLEADKGDQRDDTAPPRERDYFLSISDEAGDLSDLLPLDVRFKPLKVARFGTGDFLVLGWDEANLLPELALVKDDGTVRRFLEMEKTRPGMAAPSTHAALEDLQGAAFVTYGSEVMLTYPGTAKAIRVMSESGVARTIPIALPAGYVLHDVLVSGARWNLVVRAQTTEKDSDKLGKDDEAKEPLRRLFEMSSYNGVLLREFVFDKPSVSEVTCAVNSSLTAIFYGAVAGAEQSEVSGTQLVVSTIRR